MNKILIIRLSSIGDIVLSTPLVRAIRHKFPDAKIDFAVKKEFAELMQYNPHINQLILVDTKDLQEAKEQVSQNNYQWIVDIQKSSRASQLKGNAAAGLTTTYSKERLTRFFLINFKWNLYKTIKPVYLRYFEAASKYDIHDDGQGTEVHFSNKEEERVNQLLIQPFGKADLNLVAISPGAKFANKRWTKEGFIEVAKKIQSSYQAVIAIVGGPGEESLCDEIKAALPDPVINFAGKLSLLESAALLKKSKLLVANDSGMMHLAQSQKTPVVAIYGPTVKEFGFFPLPQKSTVIEHNLKCRPCTKMGTDKCPKKHHNCMNMISASEVYTAAIAHL